MQNNLRTFVNRRSQGREGFFHLAFAVVASQGQGPGAAGQLYAAALVHSLYGPNQIAENRLAAIGVATAQAFDQRKFDGRQFDGCCLPLNIWRLRHQCDRHT